jgi:membrane protease YdiL (CAAX protease family)
MLLAWDTGEFVRERLKSSVAGQLVVFFVLTFAIGWAAFLPVVLGQGLPAWSAFIFLFSPALAALVTVVFVDGIAGPISVLARYLRWKFHIKWYALAILLIPTIFILAAAAARVGAISSMWLGSSWYFVAAAFGYLMFINSGEEIGWRGFALPRLQRVMRSPLVAAIILGVLWGLWHLPLYLDPRQSSFPFPLFLLFVVGMSVIYSVLFNNTRGSLLMAVLLHASTDIPPRFLRIASFTPISWSILVALVWVSAIALYRTNGRVAAVTD